MGKMADVLTTPALRHLAALERVRELISRKVEEGRDFQWWIDLDGPRLGEIVTTVMDEGQGDADA